jgi:hypothetical protein
MRKYCAFSVAAAVLLGAVGGGAAAADPAPVPSALDVKLQCPPVEAPGRVRCTAELVASPGARIAWADLVLLPTPEALAPLRARFGPKAAAEAREAAWRFELAVVARRRGDARLSARVRAVVCTGDACAPVVRDVATTVSVRE